MGLKEKYRKAEQTLKSLPPRDRELVASICGDIKAAQKRLLDNASGLMAQCIQGCEGLCCKNIYINNIVDLYDFIFILTLYPAAKGEIVEGLANETLFLPANCIFLRNGVGPCIFPDTIKPEICVTTFCGDDAIVADEIRQVIRKFNKLYWFVCFRKVRLLKYLFVSRTMRSSS